MSSIEVICSDPAHPVLVPLRRWCERHGARLVSSTQELSGADFLFLVSCQSLLPASLRARYRYCLVLHASALPQGRGMSPHIWQVLQGATQITVSLLDAADPVDSGAIWQQGRFELDGTELYDEINAKLFDCELHLMDWALAHCDSSAPSTQQGEPSYYRRRGRDDSRIDPSLSIAEQFNQLRVADAERYPAFFELHGQRYEIVLKKAEKTP